MRDTEIVLKDFEQAFTQLMSKTEAPSEVRRALARFLTVTQQLTDAMRKEFKGLTDQAWVAKKFPGWNSVTDLFKTLRNEDLHGLPTYVHVRSTYGFSARARGEPSAGTTLYIEGEWPLDNQIAEDIDDLKAAIKLIQWDSQSGERRDIDPDSVTHVFLIKARDKTADKAIKMAGTDELHVLAEECFKTMKKYFEYYSNCLEKYVALVSRVDDPDKQESA